jgi:hypothetical protein
MKNERNQLAAAESADGMNGGSIVIAHGRRIDAAATSVPAIASYWRRNGVKAFNIVRMWTSGDITCRNQAWRRAARRIFGFDASLTAALWCFRRRRGARWRRHVY